MRCRDRRPRTAERWSTLPGRIRRHVSTHMDWVLVGVLVGVGRRSSRLSQNNNIPPLPTVLATSMSPWVPPSQRPFPNQHQYTPVPALLEARRCLREQTHRAMHGRLDARPVNVRGVCPRLRCRPTWKGGLVGKDKGHHRRRRHSVQLSRP